MSKLIALSSTLNCISRKIQPYRTSSSLLSSDRSLVQSSTTQDKSHFTTILRSNYSSIAKGFEGYNNNQPKRLTTIVENRRNIFTEDALLIHSLDSLRLSKGKLYESGKDRYIERIADYLDDNNSQSLCIEDLISLIALAEEDYHLDLIERVAIVLQKTQETSQPQKWGPKVMRLYYKMNKLERALTNIQDVERFDNFFSQAISFQIVMTMLFNAQRYQDVIDIYELSCNRLPRTDPNIITRRYHSVLAFAAYAKLNTPESLEQALKLFAQDTTNTRLRYRVTSFLAYLAYNQHQPATALNLISDSRGKNFLALQTLRINCLIKMGRYEDVLYHLREGIDRKDSRNPHFFLKDAIDTILDHKDMVEDDKLREDLLSLVNDIKDKDIIGNSSLESLIFKPIDAYKLESTPEDTRHPRREFNNQPQGSFSDRPRRPPNYEIRSDRRENNRRERFNRYDSEGFQ